MSYGLSARPLALLLVAVTLAHGAALWFWKGLPEHRPAPPALEVGIAQARTANPAQAKQRPKPQTPAAVLDSPANPPPASVRENQPLAQTGNPSTVAVSDKPATSPAGLTQAPAPSAAPIAQSPPRYQAAHLHNAPAEYPPQARRRGWEGKVVLKVRVLAAGTAGEIRVQTSSGYEALDQAAEEAVRRWRFIAAKRGDSAIDDWVLVPVEFRLADD